MVVSLAGLALLLAGPRALAQDYKRSPYAPTPPPNPAAPPATAFPYTGRAAPGLRGSIQSAAYQLPPAPPRRPTEDILEYGIELEPPGPARVFKLDSEASLQERMRQEARQRPVPDRITFPEEPVLGREPQPRRTFRPITMLVEPNYVCYGRLYFEQKNLERYGWDLGPVTPFLSAGAFFFDVAMLPYHLGTEPCRCYECSAGYCLPGDPVPLLLYPPELSLTGALAEAAVVTGLVAIFP